MAAPTVGARSSATPAAPTGGTPSRWAALKDGESNSTFGKARGRGGSRAGAGGRGGRGGRGGGPASRGGRNQGDSISQKPDAGLGKAPDAAVSTTSTNASVASTPSRPKPPSRKPSRNVPALVVPPSSLSAEDTPSSASRPPNRRKRSGTHNKPPLSAGLKPIVPPALDDKLLRPSPGRPMPHSAPAKDTPPHFPTSSDTRHEIDALVERVRAAAMNADNRPTTPGSHIDWAGDDDDSLPDLNDWGVTTSSNAVETAVSSTVIVDAAELAADKAEVDVISPIIMDGLRTLPEPEAKPLTPPSEEHLLQPVILTSAAPACPKNGIAASAESQVHPTPALAVETSPPSSIPSKTPSKRGSARSHAPRAFNNTPKPDDITVYPTSASSAKPSGGHIEQKMPLHPSLPAKPVTPVEAFYPKSRGATPMRSNFPSVPVPAAEKRLEPSERPAAQSATPGPAQEPAPKTVQKPETKETLELPSQAPPEHSELESGLLSDSIHASRVSPTLEKDVDFLARSEGLNASMHAPKSTSDLSIAASDTSSHSSSRPGSRSFNPTHNRAHTVGRSPYTAPPYAHHQRFSRSGNATPRGDLSTQHARTHSTPPPGSAHRSHASRPVITGDAISRLARTIGTSIPKSAPVAASKE